MYLGKVSLIDTLVPLYEPKISPPVERYDTSKPGHFHYCKECDNEWQCFETDCKNPEGIFINRLCEEHEKEE